MKSAAQQQKQQLQDKKLNANEFCEALPEKKSKSFIARENSQNRKSQNDQKPHQIDIQQIKQQVLEKIKKEKSKSIQLSKINEAYQSTARSLAKKQTECKNFNEIQNQQQQQQSQQKRKKFFSIFQGISSKEPINKIRQQSRNDNSPEPSPTNSSPKINNFTYHALLNNSKIYAKRSFTNDELKKNSLTSQQFEGDQNCKNSEKQQEIDDYQQNCKRNKASLHFRKYTIVSMRNEQKISQKKLKLISNSEFIISPPQSPAKSVNLQMPTIMKYETPTIYYMTKLQQYCQKSLITSVEHKLFKDHFAQNFNSLKYSKILQQRESNYQEKSANLPQNPHKFNMKTLLFDLDETLIHCNESLQKQILLQYQKMFNRLSLPYDFKLSFTSPTGGTFTFGVNIRPYAIECLMELSKHFEIIIFTASHPTYASKIIEQLDPEKKLIDHILYRDHCITTPEGLHIKDLRIFLNRNLEDLCLIDNATYSFALQIENGVPILPFYSNKRDNELVQLVDYVMGFLKGSIQSINRRTFQFEKYLLGQTLGEVLGRFE